MPRQIIPTGRQVAGARGLLQLTQRELATAAGVTHVTLVSFETGRRIPHPSTINAIREALERRGIIFTNGNELGIKLVSDKAIIP